MTHVSTKIHINVPPEEVINFIANPENKPKFFPTLKEVKNIQRTSGIVGTKFEWAFISIGEEVKGTSEITEYVKGERYAFRVLGGIKGYEGNYAFSAKPENGGCELSLIVDYTIPETIRGKILSKGRIIEVDETDIDRIGESETNIMLRILKSVLENTDKRV